MTGFGIFLIVAAVLAGATSLVEIGLGVARPLSQTLTTPARQTPVNTYLSLTRGSYSVYELTGQSSDNGPITFTERRTPTISPASVTVIGPEGENVPVVGLGNTTETLTRGTLIYTSAAHFTVGADGSYRVTVKAPKPTQVVIGPSLGAGLLAAWPWMLAVGASFLAFVAGIVLVIVARARRVPLVRGFTGPGGPGGPGGPNPAGFTHPPGWYTDPAAAGRMRYWDGRAWNPDAR
jgi:hypothetical protein